MHVINISECCALPNGIAAEIQHVTDRKGADLTGFFERVPFLSEFNHKSLVLTKLASGKPFIKLGKKYLGYSLSHTSNSYLLATNKDGEIGADIEKVDRNIHQKLRSRIMSENELLDDSINTLQLWTIKEAVLKLTGTGLRTNMNKVCVERVDEINFKVHHDNKDISIVSLSADGFWISVAWTLTK